MPDRNCDKVFPRAPARCNSFPRAQFWWKLPCEVQKHDFAERSLERLQLSCNHAARAHVQPRPETILRPNVLARLQPASRHVYQLYSVDDLQPRNTRRQYVGVLSVSDCENSKHQRRAESGPAREIVAPRQVS